MIIFFLKERFPFDLTTSEFRRDEPIGGRSRHDPVAMATAAAAHWPAAAGPQRFLRHRCCAVSLLFRPPHGHPTWAVSSVVDEFFFNFFIFFISLPSLSLFLSLLVSSSGATKRPSSFFFFKEKGTGSCPDRSRPLIFHRNKKKSKTKWWTGVSPRRDVGRNAENRREYILNNNNNNNNNNKKERSSYVTLW